MSHATSFLAVAALMVVGTSVRPPLYARPPASQTPVVSPLDYEMFRTKVQPILMGARRGNARCTACHARGGNAYLEPLAPGSTSYTEEQSKRNFERVSRLVVPGDPLKSLLLINPLEHEAGGSHWHAGGKHWRSQDNAEWQTLAAWVKSRGTGAPATASMVATAPMAAARQTTAGASTSTLNYDTFRTKVQPILTSARKGSARCTACHTRGGGNAYLEPLPPGSTTYTEEQSRRNFERVVRLVVPGEPLKSPLLVNPLEHEAGGSHWHGGGKHWRSQDNPEWQTIATWVRGQ